MGRVFFLLVTAMISALFLAAPLRPVRGMTPAAREVPPVFRGEAGVDVKPPGEPGRVVIVSIDYLQIRDLEEGLPANLAGLASGGAVALMNVNTGGGAVPENTHATIGAGARTLARGSAALGLGAAEKAPGGTAADEYRRRTGREPPSGSLVYLDIARLMAINGKLHYNAVPGALGTKLREAGYGTAALGNSDGPGGPARQIVSMVMDRRGIVTAGSVGGETLRVDGDFAGGFRTNYEAILEAFKGLPPDIRLVAIDLGDLARLQSARDYMEMENWRAMRSGAIRRADDFAGRLAQLMDFSRDLLLVVCPTPGDDGIKKDRMAPVILYGAGVDRGLLSSPGTRRPGIIMNVDIAPTVTDFLGISPGGFFAGRPVRVTPPGTGPAELALMYRALEINHEARPFLLKGYLFLQLILLSVALVFIFFKKKGGKFLKPFLIAVMAVPLACLALPVFPAGGTLALGAELIIIAAGLTGLIIYLHRKRGIDPFLSVCLATSAAVAADLAAGSPLQSASILGYDPIVGARFYGLGNEYMGVLIGATLVGTATAVQLAHNRRKMFLAGAGAAYLITLYLVASPQAGSNAGGAIAAVPAFLTALLLMWGVRFSRATVLSVAAATVLAVTLLVLYDLSRPAWQQSHIGRAADLVLSGGLDELAGILSRKVEMNIKLIKHTVWSRVLLVSLGVLVILFYRPVGAVEGIRNRCPYLFKGLAGVVTGSIVAFLFNDSGVVAAATAMVFGVPPLICMVLENMET